MFEKHLQDRCGATPFWKKQYHSQLMAQQKIIIENVFVKNYLSQASVMLESQRRHCRLVQQNTAQHLQYYNRIIQKICIYLMFAE